MPLAALRRLSVYTAFLSICSVGLVACGGDESPEPPPAASSSTGGGVSSSSDEPSSSSSSSSSSVSSSAESSASSSVDASSASADASSSSSEPAPDQTPDAFTFDAQSSVSLGVTVTSNTVTIQGIDAEIPISISGGQYAVNGGDFTAGAGNVENGDEVTVQVTASEDFAAELSAVLTVGDVDGSFTVTTEEEDTVPDSFGFAPLDSLALGEEVTSETVTLTGFNTPVSISVTGGEYSLDGENYTGEPGQVSAGSTVALRAIAPEGPDETQEVQLAVGAEHAVWAVTTVPDEEAPEGEIAFPPQMSATGAESLTIRGRASDELSDVAEVTLTVENGGGVTPYTLEADEETGFAEWQQAVTLAPGNNLVSLQVKDEAGNELAEPVEVTVVKQPYADPFPDDTSRFFDIYDMVLDEAHNRILLAGIDRNPDIALAQRIIIAVDLATGQRTEFARSDGNNESLDIIDIVAAALDPASNRLLGVTEDSSHRSRIYGFDLETGLGTVLMEFGVGDESVTFDRLRDIAASPSDPESFYVAANDPVRILKVNPSTGERQIITDQGAGIGEGPDITSAQEIHITPDEKTMYTGQGSELFKVDIESGNRSEIPLDYPTDEMFTGFEGLMLAGAEGELYLFEWLKGLMKKDADTGDWVEVHPYNDSDAFDGRFSSGAHCVEEDGYCFVAQDAYTAVFAYDLVTNEYVIITRYSK